MKALFEAIALLERRRQEADWEALTGLVEGIEKEQDGQEQYHTPGRLQTRIGLYDRSSANPVNWHRWFFDSIEKKPNLRVLEVGCGDGSLAQPLIDYIVSAPMIAKDVLVGRKLERFRSYVEAAIAANGSIGVRKKSDFFGRKLLAGDVTSPIILLVNRRRGGRTHESFES